jgi:RNA-binding protein YlmH
MNLLAELHNVIGDAELAGHKVQVNYHDVKITDLASTEIQDGDVIRIAKPFEMPIQFIVGEKYEQ